MEVCSVYFHEPDYKGIVSKVKAAFPKANVLLSEQGEGREILIEPKVGLFSKRESLAINYRQRVNAGYNLEDASCAVSNQLRGMYNFVAQLPAGNSELQSLLLAKIQTINVELSFKAEPKLSGAFRSLLQEIAGSYDAFLFAQPGTSISQSASQHFLDKDLHLLIDTTGQCGNGSIKVQINAALFDNPDEPTEEQKQRKKNSEQLLAARGVKINPHLPCVEDKASVNLRTKEEIIGRVYALAIIAAMGEGVPHEQLENARMGLGIEKLSPYETFLFDKKILADQEKVNAIWRYESLALLMWALGYLEPLPYPDAICDVQTIVGLILGRSRADFEKMAALRPVETILDELDKTYRMHWACVQAQISGQEPGGDLQGSVVYERHYALNWLTRYLGSEWDDVRTDT